MAIIKPLFKDYEYGWYGFMASINCYWFNTPNNHTRKLNRIDPKRQNKFENSYEQAVNGTFEQLPKLKGVIFIYGNYKTVI